MRIVELDPELLLPYLLSRRGRSQQAILDLVADQLRAGQATGEVRDGRPRRPRPGAAAGHPRLRAVGAHDGRRPGAPRRTSTPSWPSILTRAVAAVTARSAPGTGRPARPSVDLVVVGLGVTGAGVALDAVTRGLSVLAVDAHDLAFGTSRWSSKLVHGGLRYLAHGQVGDRPRERGRARILMEVDRPAPDARAADAGAAPRHRRPRPGGADPGRLRRRRRCCASAPVPPARRSPARAASPPPRRSRWRPACKVDGLRGGLLGWDGQLEDDARLVVTIARTAASYGAHIRTRARVLAADGTRRAAARRADRRRDRRRGPDGRQRRRASGPATWPTYACGRAGAATSCSAASRCPGLRVCVTAPVPGQHQPLRDGAAPARRHGLRRPHRRAGRRPGPRRAGAVGGRGRLPARRRLGDPGPAADPRRRGRRLRRAAAAARHAGRRRDRRPVPPPRRAHLARPAWSRSSAAS